MTTQNTPFGNLTTGTIVTYNDMSNVDLKFVILDTVSTQFGIVVNIMNLESHNIEGMNPSTQIDGRRWTK